MNSNRGILHSKSQETLTAHLGQELQMNAPFAIGLSNFIPVTQHCKMSPVGTDQHHVRMSCSGTPWKWTLVEVRAIADELGIHHTTVSRRLRAIGKVKKLDSWVPHETPANKNRRLEVSSSLSVRNKRESFLHRIVTSDGKWICYDNRKLSGQWLDRDQRPGRCPKPPLHTRKVLLLVWWSMVGVIHHVFLRRGDTLTADRYSAEL